MSINRKFFFQTVRNILFGGKLTQKQVDGMTAILDEWENNYSKKDDRWLAYMLATAYHETDKTMQPITEYATGWDYDPSRNPKKARKLGNIEKGDGPKYKGRGFPQLTGKANYIKMSKILRVDLVSNPDRALEMDLAVKIMFIGMMQGIFTGKKLGQYFGPIEDAEGARAIVNGKDRKALIADHYRKFYQAISYTT